MGVIEKLFALVMFPLSVLIVLQELEIYALELPIDKLLLGSALMIALQTITIIMLHFTNRKLSLMNIVTALIFILTAIAAVLSMRFGLFQKEAAIILGVMMFVEALYALH